MVDVRCDGPHICPAAPVNELPENIVTNVVEDHFTRFRANSHSKGDGDSSSRMAILIDGRFTMPQALIIRGPLQHQLFATLGGKYIHFESSLGLIGLTGVGNVHPTESYEECVEDSRRFKGLSECLGSWVEFYIGYY